MVVIPRADSSEQGAKRPRKTGKISLYPLVGIVLALLTALLSYGGLLLLLLDDWSFFLSSAEGNPRR